MRQRVIARQQGRCASCGKVCAELSGGRWRTGRLGGQVHHIVPLSRGGSNQDTNAVLLCEACHRRAHGCR
ncbi:HNH endonuclease [Gordonibacter urolithinfaciens]|uniref:HNH endonuclease n=1 Tax=Gordonibacter urolithinfaciens TaxID=1335613 RepID=UPI003A91ACE9